MYVKYPRYSSFFWHLPQNLCSHADHVVSKLVLLFHQNRARPEARTPVAHGMRLGYFHVETLPSVDRRDSSVSHLTCQGICRYSIHNALGYIVSPEIQDVDQVQRTVHHHFGVTFFSSGPHLVIVNHVSVERQGRKAEESHWGQGEMPFAVDVEDAGLEFGCRRIRYC